MGNLWFFHKRDEEMNSVGLAMSGNMLAERFVDYSVLAKRLGSTTFKQTYGIDYAYLAGSMYRRTSSKEMVVALGKAGMLGFLGIGGLSPEATEDDINYIQAQLNANQAYGVNLICNLNHPEKEMRTVELFLKKGIRNVEAAAFLQITPALVYYRLKGFYQDDNGNIANRHHLIAKVSRPEVASAFMSPPPDEMVNALLAQHKITEQQARWARYLPMCDDICVEADSGGHTDRGNAMVLMPAMQAMRNQIMNQHRYRRQPCIGLAGGIGTPEAVAAAFIMGADFVMTGSINQCTVEAGTSDSVKDLLQNMNIQDTEYAPAGDMFEIGASVQVLKKGVFFPARANRLYMLYSHYDSIDAIPKNIQRQIQEHYFRKSFAEVWQETRAYYEKTARKHVVDQAEQNPKTKMAMIFRWYFLHCSRLAFNGDLSRRIDYQVHTGPALGAFNRWVKGSLLENWRRRRVDKIGIKLMHDTARLLHQRLSTIFD